MQKELDLIIAHRAISEEISELKIKIIYVDASQKDEYERLLRDFQEDLEELEEELLLIDDKSATLMKRDALLKVMSRIGDGLRPNKYGNPVSRNQGMVLHNYIYGKVMYDMKWAFDGDYGTIPIPEFYYREGGNFDSRPLIDLINKRQKELTVLDEVNYLSVKSFLENVLEEIRQMSLSDSNYQD